jgi:hypothetical protein
LSDEQRNNFKGTNATDFLGFIYKYIPDINFKISIAAIKMVTDLLRENLANLNKHYAELLRHLIEKLSDSK